MQTIPATSHQHHAVLLPHVDGLLPLAEALETEPVKVLEPKLQELHAFLVGQLIPHMEMAEATLYPELEKLLSDTKVMAPMRREHAEVRRLTDDLGRLTSRLREPLGTGEAMALRRVLLRLFAILKVHLAEEEHYLPILDHNLTAEETRTIAGAMEHATVQPL